MLYARVLRCPHAHARVTSLDTDAASKIPGVKAIIQAPLTELRFAGAPVAAVAATTPEIAGDALRAIKVNYEVLRHVVHAPAAIRPDAPKVVAEENNLQEKGKNGDQQKAEAAFATADAIVEGEYISARVHHACLETHGMVVDYRGGDAATIYASTQGTFTIAADAAKELGLTESAVTVSVEHMGGGFGSKFGLGLEGLLACRLSKQTKSPVKLMFTRYDEFVMAGNRSGSWQKLKAGVKKDGTIVALNARQYRLGGLGPGSQAGQPYIYRMGDTYREVYALHTNEDSSVAMRAPGHPQASFAVESLMDELAYKIKMDPVEFRIKNLRDEVYHRQLERAAKEIGWSRRNPIAGGNAGPMKRGMGCAVGTWGGGGNNQCKVDVTISRDGSVVVAVGTQDLGTGTRTYTRAIVAEELGLTINDVKERIGNSKLGAANPSGGSTTAASLSPSVKDAAIKARMMMAERVAPLLGNAKPEEIVFAGGKVSAAGGQSLSWQQATASLPAAGITSHGEWRADLQARGVHGVCFAEVEVDVETGHVKPIKMVHIQDGGLPLNRLTMESQINGGMIQSLGMALWEGRVMDAQLGMMLNPGFGDYKLPGCLEMPELVPLIDDDDKREAVIGIAEGCIIPAVGALVNAVFNACGVRARELPVTPDKILMGLAKGTQITQI
jgi:xanthine dehydrogenase YagR molybdenum-binding subunit